MRPSAPWNWEKLARELDRKNIPRGAREEFFRRRAESYKYLLQAMRDGPLNARQAGHAVWLLAHLSRTNPLDEQSRLFEQLQVWAVDERVEVRSAAVIPLHTRAWQRQLGAPSDEEKQREAQQALEVLRRALEMGLDARRDEWLRHALARDSGESSA